MPSIRPKYLPLPSSDSDSDSYEPKTKSSSPKITLTRNTCIVISFLVLTAFVTLVSTITLLLNEKDGDGSGDLSLREPKWKNCGGNAGEARRRGCSFDWMMSAWYTPECHHADLLEEAYESREWEWYLFVNGTGKVSTEVIARGEHEVAWTTEWFHREHCSYMWKKQLRYVNDWRFMDNETHDYEHTAHCAGFVLQPSILKAKNNTFLVPQVSVGFQKITSQVKLTGEVSNLYVATEEMGRNEIANLKAEDMRFDRGEDEMGEGAGQLGKIVISSRIGR